MKYFVERMMGKLFVSLILHNELQDFFRKVLKIVYVVSR